MCFDLLSDLLSTLDRESKWTGSKFGSAAVHVRGPIVRITAMVTAMTAAMAMAMAMATLPAMMLHSTPSFVCSFSRSNRCTLVALRRVAAAASGSEAAAAPPASSVEEVEGPSLPCGTCNSKG